MKMMNKEECSEVLTRLLRPYFASVEIQNAYHSINKGHSIDYDSNVLTLLIEEHYNPQPYKFEEGRFFPLTKALEYQR